MPDDGRHDVHDVAVPLDGHEVDDLNGARGADPTEIVAGQVDEHDVLGPLLWIREHFCGQRVVVLGRRAAWPAAGDRMHRRPTVHHCDVRFGTRAHDVEAVEPQQIQVRTRIARAQHPVDVESADRRRRLEPLTGHDLEDVAGPDVFTRPLDPGHVFLARRAAQRWRRDRVAHDRDRGRRRTLQRDRHLVEALLGILGRIARQHVGDEQHAAVVVIQHREVGHQEHHELRQVQIVDRVVGQLLEPAHRVVGDEADHAANQGRQGGVARAAQRCDGAGENVKRRADSRDAGGRVADPMCPPVLLGECRGGADADERVTRPGATVLGGLQQEGARPVLGELAIEADRSLTVGEELAGDPTRRVRRPRLR